MFYVIRQSVTQTSVIVTSRGMRYCAAVTSMGYAHKRSFLLYFAMAINLHLFLDGYLYSLNIHDSNETPNVRHWYLVIA